MGEEPPTLSLSSDLCSLQLYAARALLLEQVVRLFSFLSFFKQRSSLSIVKLFFSPQEPFFFPFLWSAVSQNIGEVCTEVTGEGCIRGSGLDYLETWGGALHRGVSCKGVSWYSRVDPLGREETNVPHPTPWDVSKSPCCQDPCKGLPRCPVTAFPQSKHGDALMTHLRLLRNILS